MRKRITESRYYKLVLSLMTGLAIVAATLVIIFYSKGYRLAKTGVSETGQLVLKSKPDAASVFIDGKFVAATNSTLNLPPGEYSVRIVKDGYSPWEKKLKIEKEVVTPTDAILFPTVPEFRRFTTTGALNPVVSLDRTKIAYGVASSSAYPPKNGVYVASIAENQNMLFSSGVQFVVRDTQFAQFSAGKFLFSPDSKQLLVYFLDESGEFDEGQENVSEYGKIDLNRVMASYLFDTGRLTQEEVPDVTITLFQILDSWEKERKQEKSLFVNSLRSSFRKIASSSMEIKEFTIDQSKIIYLAKEDVEIPVIIKPGLVGVNSTPETRKIEKGKMYVYDIREDRNYEIVSPGDAVPLWLDTSRHYMTIETNKIYVTEFDGQNKIVVYSGPYDKSLVTNASSGDRIFFLTTFSPDTPLNLYSLLLR